MHQRKMPMITSAEEVNWHVWRKWTAERLKHQANSYKKIEKDNEKREKQRIANSKSNKERYANQKELRAKAQELDKYKHTLSQEEARTGRGV